PTYENKRNATIEWEIGWLDGIVDGACADASWYTCNDGFKNYPVAIASNRAEARCIRAALGIETCSYEEVGPQDEDLSGPGNDQQKGVIELLIKRNKLDVSKVAEMVGPELSKKIIKNDAIVLTDITHQEAIKILGILNKQGSKK
ncbi:MAG: hypothetical protein MN733_40795, partial [Nitrososphaera sp.]|nr:hypothetical protein [Nitrososphaera sp.]